MMQFLEHLQGLVSSKIAIAKGIVTLVNLETKLLGASIYPFLITLGLTFTLILTVWFTGMLLLGYLFTRLAGGNLLAGAGCVFLLNTGILLYVLKRLSTHLHQMSFAKTRACFSNNQWSDEHEPEETTAAINR